MERVFKSTLDILMVILLNISVKHCVIQKLLSDFESNSALFDNTESLERLATTLRESYHL